MNIFRHKWSKRFNASIYGFDIHGAQGLMTVYFTYMEHKVNAYVYILLYKEHKV